MKMKNIAKKITLSSVLIIYLLPLVFVLTNSIMSGNEVIDRYTHIITPTNIWDLHIQDTHFVKPSLIPAYITFTQYEELLTTTNIYIRMFWNTVVITLPSIIGQLIVDILAAYSFEQMTWKHKEKFFLIYLLAMILPTQIIVLANFLGVENLGIENDYIGIILSTSFSPFGVFLIRQLSKGFPKEYKEAVFADGGGHLDVLIRVFIPIIKPVLALMVLLTFIERWNDLERPLLFIKETIRLPLAIYLSEIIVGDLSSVFAVSLIYMMPVTLAFYSIRDELKYNMEHSGIKY